jgi:hypothetical protein
MLKVLCCAAAIAALTAPLAQAQGGTAQWNKKTHLTFSGPVQVPGKTLPAGTYTFRAMDLVADRHVLQILDADEKSIIATVMTQPQRRAEVAENNVVMFSERPAGQAPAIKSWYYPAQEIGNEFVYPRAQAIQIAKASNTTVLSRADEGTTDEAMRGAEIGRVNAEGQIVEDEGSMTAGNNPAPASTQAQATPAPAPAPAQSVGTSGRTEPARELPRTAGNLVLAELLSALSIAGFLGARRLRKQEEGA